MYSIEFYEKANGECELWDFLEDLRCKIATNKDARIQYKQMMLHIELLEKNGTNLGENFVKHIDEDIWELRPGRNRVFFFYYNGNGFVLLHHFMKKTQKTPSREINKAKSERDDYIARKVADKNENLE